MRTSIRCLSLVAVIAVTIFAVKLLVAFKPPPKNESREAQVPRVQTAIVAANTLKPTTQATGRLESLRSQFIFSIPRRHHHREIGLEVNLVDFARKTGQQGHGCQGRSGAHAYSSDRAHYHHDISRHIAADLFCRQADRLSHSHGVSLGFGLLFTTGPIPVDTKFIYDRR